MLHWSERSVCAARVALQMGCVANVVSSNNSVISLSLSLALTFLPEEVDLGKIFYEKKQKSILVKMSLHAKNQHRKSSKSSKALGGHYVCLAAHLQCHPGSARTSLGPKSVP